MRNRVSITPSLSFLIPAYNDEKTISQAVEEALRVGRIEAGRFEIIVVNDGSIDKTAKILDQLKKKYRNLRIITHAVNQGYGATIKELYYAGRGKWLCTIPGDYQVGANELRKLLPYREKADMIIGWRKNRRDPASRLLQSALYNSLLALLFGVNLHDVNSIRLMRQDILTRIRLQSNSAFVDAELAIKAVHAGFRIMEVPISHRKSVKEGSGGTWRTILPTVWDMIRYRIERICNPMGAGPASVFLPRGSARRR